MLNADFGLQVSAQPFGYLPGYPVLAPWGLDNNIQQPNKNKQAYKKPLQYFFKSPQVQLFKL
jgi:hypothetical protein